MKIAYFITDWQKQNHVFFSLMIEIQIILYKLVYNKLMWYEYINWKVITVSFLIMWPHDGFLQLVPLYYIF